MNKYVYDNHEIHEGMFVILQTLDALEGKYCGIPTQKSLV